MKCAVNIYVKDKVVVEDEGGVNDDDGANVEDKGGVNDDYSVVNFDDVGVVNDKDDGVSNVQVYEVEHGGVNVKVDEG
ncbi:unnamed protein product [Lathyrus sativus]|nr:unnamed protein product [Lathyrus sativus]